MKKFVAAAAITAFVGTATHAGGLLDASMEQEVMEPVVMVDESEGSVSSTLIVAGLIALLLGAASSGGGS